MDSVLRCLAGAQLRPAVAESALEPGEVVEPRTSGPSYSALTPTSGRFFAAVVVAVAVAAAVVAETSVAVMRYLLQQQSAVHRSGPGPGAAQP